MNSIDLHEVNLEWARCCHREIHGLMMRAGLGGVIHVGPWNSQPSTWHLSIVMMVPIRRIGFTVFSFPPDSRNPLLDILRGVVPLMGDDTLYVTTHADEYDAIDHTGKPTRGPKIQVVLHVRDEAKSIEIGMYVRMRLMEMYDAV